MKEPEIIAPLSLGGIHRDIRLTEEFGMLQAVSGADTDPNTCGQDNFPLIELKRIAKCHQDVRGRRNGFLGTFRLPQYHNEFIPSQASNRIRFSDDTLKSCGGQLQQIVPGFMSQCVIDGFEIVEIDKQDRNIPSIGSRLGDCRIQPFNHEKTIRKACEGIIIGLILDSRFLGFLQ